MLALSHITALHSRASDQVSSPAQFTASDLEVNLCAVNADIQDTFELPVVVVKKYSENFLLIICVTDT